MDDHHMLDILPFRLRAEIAKHIHLETLQKVNIVCWFCEWVMYAPPCWKWTPNTWLSYLSYCHIEYTESVTYHHGYLWGLDPVCKIKAQVPSRSAMPKYQNIFGHVVNNLQAPYFIGEPQWLLHQRSLLWLLRVRLASISYTNVFMGQPTCLMLK